MKFITCVLAIVCLPVALVWAEVADGNALLPQCSAAVEILDSPKKNHPSDLYEEAFHCTDYVNGVADMGRIVEDMAEPPYSVGRPLFCLPAAGPISQVVRVVLKYLQDNPKELHKDKGVLAVFALMKEFPCKEKK